MNVHIMFRKLSESKPDIILNCVLLCLNIMFFCAINAPAQSSDAWPPIDPDDPKGHNLPPGVPRMVDANGNVVYMTMSFTTPAYQEAAFNLLARECGQVAKDLSLSEDLPIVKSNLTMLAVGPFGYNYYRKSIGSLSTKHYYYCVANNYKFNQISVANYDRVCLTYRTNMLPVDKLDFGSAGLLATQWLTAALINVKAMNRDCKFHAAVSPYWNGLRHLGDMPLKQFIPIYFVWWTSRENDAQNYGNTAYVELYLPEHKLLQLSVDEPRYILRKPLIFTNMAALFPGTAKIEFIANAPGNGVH